jgi:DNA-binding NtrC family response regulator
VSATAKSRILSAPVSNPPRRPIPPTPLAFPRPSAPPRIGSVAPSAPGTLPPPGIAPQVPLGGASSRDPLPEERGMALGPPSGRIPEFREHAATIPQMSEEVALPRLTITVERDGGQASGKQLVYDGDECRIGSHPSNDVPLINDRTVSRFHCRIRRDGMVWRVEDTSSRNGTRLDGVRIRDAELGPTGTITVGESVLRVSAAEAQRAVELPVVPAFGQLAGASIAMRKLFALLERVSSSDINVLIQGESGTGKELVASEIVRRGPRAAKPFVIVDCGAISPQLIESELFGHVRGSFTGADRDRIGAFESANTGTVFLDEIGELPLELQPKLLRALEAKEIRRVGETRPRRIDVRVISATNRELDREVNKGRFREDLYFRLAVISVRVPSLRERVEDLQLLVQVFLGALGCPEEARLFPREVLAEMSRHDWPGNVRELRNYVERAVVLKSGHADIGESPMQRGMEIGAGSSGGASGEKRQPFRIAKESAVDAFERAYLAALLEEAQGNMSKAARLAAMDRMYLHKLVQKHGLRSGGSQSPGPLGEF